MKKYLMILTLIAWGSPAFAERAPAPETLMLFGVDAFSNGQSNNLGPMVKQTISEFWEKGVCTDADGYAKCDALQFGVAAYPDKVCGDSLVYYQYPMEDGGDTVEDVVGGIHTEKGVTLCDDGQHRPHDAALRIHRTTTFPGEDLAADAVQDTWWEHPHLVLKIVGDLAQEADGSPDGRVKLALQEACTNVQGGTSERLPSIPTWVMMFRKATDSPVSYGQLLAAAGGTGVCCYGNNCDRDDADKRIDVCEHINQASETDTKIRKDLKDGLYNCGRGDDIHEVGAMHFPVPNGNSKFGTLPEIRCHMVGGKETGGGSCDDLVKTDILGLFSCIRQLPRGIYGDDDFTVMACPESYASLDDCKKLSSDDVSFIDERKTLFAINDRAYCDGTWNFEVTFCPLEDSPCLVDGATGRCALGTYQCIDGEDVCVADFEAMPEICNGLDDDCDGRVDNMGDSWENFSYTLPSQYVGLDCRENEVCACPGNHTDSYGGADFMSYLETWTGGCLCGEGVEAPESSPAIEPVEPQASCANAATTPSALVLILLGFFGIGMRRFARSRG